MATGEGLFGNAVGTVPAIAQYIRNEEEEKKNRIEFITAQGAFMEKALPMAEAAPEVLPVISALWKFSVGAFKIGKTLEGEFDAVIDKAKEAAALLKDNALTFNNGPALLKVTVRSQSRTPSTACAAQACRSDAR